MHPFSQIALLGEECLSEPYCQEGIQTNLIGISDNLFSGNRLRVIVVNNYVAYFSPQASLLSMANYFDAVETSK